MRNGSVQSREGALNLLGISKNKKIPMLIFSAGLGDLIKEWLKYVDKECLNIHIVSNFFKFDELGNVKGYANHIIHSSNKKEIEIKETPYYTDIKGRRNAILIGDQLEDLQMTEGLSHDTVITIGFLNEEVEENLDIYSKSFDIVILKDGPMDYVNELIVELIR